MVQKIVIGYKKLIEQASKVVKTISVEDSKHLTDNEKYTFIDLRDFREILKEGKIPGAFSCPRGMLEFWIDQDSPYHKEIFNKDTNYIFYCASAWRSALSGKIAVEMGLSPVFHLEGGFSNWKKLGGSIEMVKQ